MGIDLFYDCVFVFLSLRVVLNFNEIMGLPAAEISLVLVSVRLPSGQLAVATDKGIATLSAGNTSKASQTVTGTFTINTA